MSQDTEVDMKEVELNELEPEKQPMNAASGAAVAVAGGAEKNGLVKIKRWWHKGALYRIGDLQAFVGSDEGNLAGLKGHLDYLSTLKVKGLVLGPIHKNPKDDIAGTNLEEIDPTLGSTEDFDNLLQSAKKKSIRVILDLTPNYRGQNSWFLPTDVTTVATKVKVSVLELMAGIRVILDLTPNYRGQNSWFLPTDVTTVATKVKDALGFWLQAGVDGFQVRDVENLKDAFSLLADWQNITSSFSEDRLFIAGTNSPDLQQIMSLLGSTKDLLLTNSYLSTPGFTGEHTKFLVTQYLNSTGSHWRSWSLSQAGLLSSFIPAQLLRLYQLLLFTLPGTPIFSYGDEIGLQVAAVSGQPMEAPVMLWDESSFSNVSGFLSVNRTVKGQSEDPDSFLSLFRRLSDQRGKERSLLHGDFHALSSEPALFSYVRHWDQNERFLVVLNFGNVGVSTSLATSSLPASTSLPASADVLLSTQPGRQEGTSLTLERLHLEPYEGLLLRFPYVA
ncbi:4F2 cell-surface antigen heavy chain [Tupaia chinensis]|uniref:4F2 cell-surface antigen heavy chain n=1 Tax=Tupaia chinensis TaxID=246437 RepID=L9JNG1_TUPCH|nr:4F2 cell-surface antigen heavy chain [Tupaia chinensis]